MNHRALPKRESFVYRTILKKTALAGVLPFLGLLPLSAADTLQAEYKFYWKGLLVASAQTDTLVAKDGYDFSFNFQMRGVAKLFSNGRSVVKAKGKLGDDGTLTPEIFISDGRWDGEDYAQTIRFDENGVMAEQILDWPDKWIEESKREPIPEDLQVGPDPASLMVALIRVPLTRAVDGTPVVLRAFDGDSVFDWNFGCASEPVVIEPSSHSPFAGDAHECGFSANLVAGKRILTEKQKKKAEKQRIKEEKRRAKGKDVNEDEPPKLWVQSFADGAYILPVRAELTTGMGRIVGYLSSLEVKADTLHVDAASSEGINADTGYVADGRESDTKAAPSR